MRGQLAKTTLLHMDVPCGNFRWSGMVRAQDAQEQLLTSGRRRCVKKKRLGAFFQ
jgi:hypothetical protein